MPWLLNVAYVALLAALSPMLIWRIVVRGKYRTGWREKLLGQVARRGGDRPCLWFHAVSVGEVLQLEPVLKELRVPLAGRRICDLDDDAHRPLRGRGEIPAGQGLLLPARLLLGRARSRRPASADGDRAGRARALAQLHPARASLGHPRRSDQRPSERTKPSWLPPAAAAGVASLGQPASDRCANPAYAERFLELGASRQQLSITGSIKFDRVETDRRNPKTLELRAAFGIGESEPVFVAGSTQESEEAAAIDAYLAVRSRFPALRLILVPRHKERFEDVARLIESRGLPLCRRSSASNTALRHDSRAVLLLDTLGELSACWPGRRGVCRRQPHESRRAKHDRAGRIRGGRALRPQHAQLSRRGRATALRGRRSRRAQRSRIDGRRRRLPGPSRTGPGARGPGPRARPLPAGSHATDDRHPGELAGCVSAFARHDARLYGGRLIESVSASPSWRVRIPLETSPVACRCSGL